MWNPVSTAGDDGGRGRGALTSERVESRAGSALSVGGAMMLASLAAPVALGPVVEQAWVPGVVLVAAGVLAAAAGLFGLYEHTDDEHPALAKTGAAGAAVAGLAGMGLLGLVGIVSLTATAGGPGVAEPVEVFVGLGLSVAAGLSVGFLSFGVGAWRSDTSSPVVGKLLVGGGGLLFAATVGELLRAVVGAGPPPWVVFPVIVLVAVDTVVVGRYL